MRSRVTRAIIFSSVALILLCGPAFAQQARFDASKLAEAFKGAQKVDLKASRVSSVVTLRETISIPPPADLVLLKTFDRASLPPVLKPAFHNPNISGVTIGGKYIAIIRTPLKKEYDDIVRHEMVHAYISLASPKPLPFWFQEGCAVHLSMDKDRKFYGQPAEDKVGVMMGKTVELSDTYKQKLQSFHFLIEKVGKKKFYKWLREAVATGNVDAKPILGIKSGGSESLSDRRPFPLWLGGVIGGVMILALVVGYYSSKRNSEFL